MGGGGGGGIPDDGEGLVPFTAKAGFPISVVAGALTIVDVTPVLFAIFELADFKEADFVAFVKGAVPVIFPAGEVALRPAAFSVVFNATVDFLLFVGLAERMEDVVFNFADPTSVEFVTAKTPPDVELDIVIVVFEIIVVVLFIIIPGKAVTLAPCDTVTVDVTVSAGDETVEVIF